MKYSRYVITIASVVAAIINILADNSLTELGRDKIKGKFLKPFPKKEYYTTKGWIYKRIALAVVLIGFLVASAIEDI